MPRGCGRSTTAWCRSDPPWSGARLAGVAGAEGAQALVHHDPGPHRRAGPGGAAAVGGVARAPADPGDVPGQPRQHDEALVQRSVPVDPARGAERVRDRPLLDRVLLQPGALCGHRVPPELLRARRPAALPAGGLRRPGPRFLQRELLPSERISRTQSARKWATSQG